MNRHQDPLRELQRRFAAALRGPRRGRAHGGVPQGVRVYVDAYEARLVEVLGGDYPATRAWLGPDRFATRARAYVRAHPSRHANLNRFGAQFPTFLRRQRGCPRFAASLARFELAVTRAFDAPAAGALAMAVPGAPATITGHTRLRVHPSVQLLRLPAAVVDCFAAWRAGRGLGAAAKAPAASRRPVDLLIVRTAGQVVQRRLPRAAAAVLRALQGGLPLGRALAGATVDAPVAEWFARWRDAGVFAGWPTTSAPRAGAGQRWAPEVTDRGGEMEVPPRIELG